MPELNWKPIPRRRNPDASEIAKQAAAKLSPEKRSERARQGGNAVLHRYGLEYFSRIATGRTSSNA